MLHKLRQSIEEMLREAGVTGAIELTVPPKPELGDFAFPCFALAKEMKKSPNEVAKEIKKKLEIGNWKLGVIERIEALGPYVNFYLATEQIAQMVIGQITRMKERYGSNDEGKGKSVLIEYPSNNTHKEFHIGHFRNVCIGNPLVQLYRVCGYETHPINYLNDFGAHVARCLWGLTKLHAQEQPPENKQKWLGDIYAEASIYLKEHPEEQGEVAGLQQKLEAHDEKVWQLFMETRQWSMDQFARLFKELGVEHEAEFYEKDVKAEGQKIVDELLARGIAQVGERGAIIVDLAPYQLDIALVRKADGTGLYLTSDFALAHRKFERFDVDESITITGQEQVFYFKQLFKILELFGFKKKLTHIGYALVTKPEGKMSSRLGNVILYEDLRDEVYAKMYLETKGRHTEWSEEQIADTVKKLTMAALKFDMQKHEANKNIVFDIKEATSFEGFSGPYVLYVVARINSLLRKYEIGNWKLEIREVKAFGLITKPEEKRLALMLAEYGEVIKKALVDYNPSVIARYCFDVAQAFNDFYNKHSVLNAESEELMAARLALSEAVKQVLTNALRVLTIETVEEM